MATTPPKKRSKFLSDKDYENLIGWELDNKNTTNRLIGQGDRYDGINEAVQNAVDSPEDPYKDKNPIHITIPCLGDPEYGELVMRIVDHGASLLKEYKTIHDFIYAKKSISLKGDLDIGQNGQGMAQYQKISRTQRVTTRTNEMLYRFYIVPSEDDRSAISFTTPEDHPANEYWTKEWNMPHRGVMIEWFDPYEEASDIDIRKAVNIVREIYGWRLMEAPNTELFVNEVKVEIPDYLVGQKENLKFGGRMGFRTIIRDGIPKKVNPEIRYFTVEDKKKGRGMIVIHVKGYRICEIPSGLDKAGTLYINCNELSPILTPNRKGFDDDKFIEDLKAHCRGLMRDLPDIKDDTQKSERKAARSVKEILSKGLGKYLERHMKHMKMEALRKKKEEKQINPTGGEKAGYPKSDDETVQAVATCELCHHLMLKSRKWRKQCECECHIPRHKGPNKHTSTVGIEDSTLIGMVENEECKPTKKGFEIRYVKFGPFIDVFYETGHIDINKEDRLYAFCIKDVPPKLSAERMAPYMAEVAMSLENPKAYEEMEEQEYKDLLHAYTIEVLEFLGERF